ncbi:MAG: MFS transporter [Acidimicrobiia bacterium]|nr:MFS transporter [Acidimicrobiia bacterium]MYC57822.1 MFS transporter [Acidimicrobiia bacterium]MYI29819.1 MFS transporter [Acidimicrobiia bacterium]
MSLRHKVDFRRLLIGQSASALGDWMGTFALMALVNHLSDSATAVGGILAFRLIPAALGGTLAAKLTSRWDRRRTMITMDLLRAAMIAAVPFVQELWWVYLWALAIEAPSVVFLASRDSTIPDLADEADLPLANAAMMSSSYGNIPVGAGLFALFAALPLTDGWLGSHPYALVFWIDALTFLVSAYFIARITQITTLQRHAAPRKSPEASLNGSHGESRGKSSQQSSQQSSRKLRDAWAVPLVRRVLPATAAAAVGLGALFSLGIKLVREELGASDAQYGILIVLFGVGAGCGLALAHRSRHLDLLMLTRRGALAMGALIALMSQSPTVWLTFLGAVGFGAAATVTLTSGMSALQSRIPSEQERVLAFSAFHVVIRIGLGIAALGAGAVGDGLNEAGLSGTRAVLLTSGLLVLFSAATVRPVLDVEQTQ